jgi:hypothetical protein
MTKPVIVSIALILSLGCGSAYAAPPVEETHFVDPTARLRHQTHIRFGDLVYVAPFATLRAGTDREHRIGSGIEVTSRTVHS